MMNPIGYYYNRMGESASKIYIYDVRPYAKENFNPMFINSPMYNRDSELYNQVLINFLGIPGQYVWINVLKSDIVITKEA